jgi:hypothetical protein
MTVVVIVTGRRGHGERTTDGRLGPARPPHF